MIIGAAMKPSENLPMSDRTRSETSHGNETRCQQLLYPDLLLLSTAVRIPPMVVKVSFYSFRTKYRL